ncbi:MAG: antibiotic biosynthesis monooxygenase [Deltaproteobacteria bacterium]|nr:antibiotic biosynthesis monooxygenase [Deltaproteobacteria bacterium]
MKISAVTVTVKDEFVEDFIEASLTHQKNTTLEKGNLRFDFLQSKSEPNMFLFYEVYQSDSDIEKHRQADSYKIWRQTVDEWMAIPRKGIRYRPLAPIHSAAYRYPDWMVHSEE